MTKAGVPDDTPATDPNVALTREADQLDELRHMAAHVQEIHGVSLGTLLAGVIKGFHGIDLTPRTVAKVVQGEVQAETHTKVG